MGEPASERTRWQRSRWTLPKPALRRSLKGSIIKKDEGARIPFRPGERYSTRMDTLVQTKSVFSSFACKTAAEHTFRSYQQEDRPGSRFVPSHSSPANLAGISKLRSAADGLAQALKRAQVATVELANKRARITLFAVSALCVMLVAAAIVAIVSKIRFEKDLDPAEEQRKSVDDLQTSARKIGRKLGRSASAFRWMSRLLAAIEIVGAAYFTWSGYSPTDTGANIPLNSSHLSPIAYLGFAVIFAATIQNRVHPYAKGVELQFRVWELANALRRSTVRKTDPRASQLLIAVPR
jgi:hypothetical protein